MNINENISWWGSLPLNPFRLFFPMGLLFGVLGVGHWVLWSVGVEFPSIALVHASLQTQGFLTSFVIGFLMTAFPRFTGSWPASRLELSLMFLSMTLFLLSTLMQQWVISQISFLVLIGNLMVFASRRFPHRNKPLPPSFLLMGFGFLHAFLGTSFILWSRFGMSHFPLFSIGRQMVQVGFLLCMVLGVTGKLAPFLLGYTDDPEKSTELRGVWTRGPWAVLAHGLTGLGIMVSFMLGFIHPWGSAVMRALIVTIHLVLFARIARPLKKKTTLMFLFHLSCWMVPLGLWAGVLWPAYRIASLHVLFIGGYSLMIFSFGTLIVLSHSMKASLINGRLISLRVIGGLVLISLVFRLFSELVPFRYKGFIHTSSGLWVLAVLIWGAVVSPAMFGRLVINKADPHSK
ncbi:MAG: hypothetical protein KCHDKBKB_00290 [Elusimicrobia bacterium]|nr:hypothetical protein [Elusimicrobiota bacterium]